MENIQSITVYKLSPSDHNWVVELLEKAKLPVSDVNLEKQVFLKITSDNKLAAIGALEISGTYALLRSVVVPQNLQRRGAGISITKALIGEARNRGLTQLFLLTETADKFFNKIGFTSINRTYVPQEILNMEEFASICPSSAICMTLEI